MCAELTGEPLVFFAAADGHDSIAESCGELHAHMAEAADALDGNKVARQSAAVTKRIVSGQAEASRIIPAWTIKVSLASCATPRSYLKSMGP